MALALIFLMLPALLHMAAGHSTTTTVRAVQNTTRVIRLGIRGNASVPESGAGCPNPALQKVIRLSSQEMSYGAATTHCDERGETLLTVNSRRELKLVTERFAAITYGESFWVGASYNELGDTYSWLGKNKDDFKVWISWNSDMPNLYEKSARVFFTNYGGRLGFSTVQVYYGQNYAICQSFEYVC